MTDITRNAQIKSTHLGYEDHGILSCYLQVDFDGSVQSFGGYALDSPKKEGDEFLGRFGTAYGMEFVRLIINTVGVSNWEALAGKYLRIKCSSEFGPILAIGHITDDKWFCPKTDLAEFANEALAASNPKDTPDAP